MNCIRLVWATLSLSVIFLTRPLHDFIIFMKFLHLHFSKAQNWIKLRTKQLEKSSFQLQSTQLLGPKKDGRKTQSAIAIVAASAFFDTWYRKFPLGFVKLEFRTLAWFCKCNRNSHGNPNVFFSKFSVLHKTRKRCASHSFSQSRYLVPVRACLWNNFWYYPL